MTSQALPDGWALPTGTWGTDADRDESTVLSGFASIRLKNTAVATTVLGPVTPITRGQTTSKSYEAVVTFQADSTTAGHTVSIKVYTYDEDMVAVGSYTVNSGVVLAANTWYTRTLDFAVTSTDERYARIEIAKAAQAFNVYVDTAEVLPIAPYFKYSLTSDQAITSGTWNAIASWTTTATNDATVVSSYKASFCRSKAGVLTGRVTWTDSIPDGTMIGVRITGAPGTPTTQFKVGGAGLHVIQVSWAGFVDAWVGASMALGQVTYYLEAFQDSGSDKDAQAYFSGMQAGF